MVSRRKVTVDGGNTSGHTGEMAASTWSTRTRPPRGPKFSRGAQLLSSTLEEKGWSQTRLKRELGTANAASYWVHGDRRPSLEAALRLRDLLGIPVDAWVEPAVETTKAASSEAA